MKLVYIVAAACMFTFLSCNDDEDQPEYDVIFNIIEPEEGVVYASGEEFHIEVDIEGTLPIGNIEMLLHNMTTGDTMWYYSTTTSQDYFAYHDHPILAVVNPSMCHFEVSAWEISYENRITQDVHFEINP